MRVEIDPSDVVSVPLDCDCQKLRTAKYKVVALHETIERPLDDGIYGEYDEELDYPSHTVGRITNQLTKGVSEFYLLFLDTPSFFVTHTIFN